MESRCRSYRHVTSVRGEWSAGTSQSGPAVSRSHRLSIVSVISVSSQSQRRRVDVSPDSLWKPTPITSVRTFEDYSKTGKKNQGRESLPISTNRLLRWYNESKATVESTTKNRITTIHYLSTNFIFYVLHLCPSAQLSIAVFYSSGSLYFNQSDSS